MTPTEKEMIDKLVVVLKAVKELPVNERIRVLRTALILQGANHVVQ